MRFGVTVLPSRPAGEALELLQRAEGGGFEHGWVFDTHVLAPDPYPLLTLAATRTERLRLGLCVAAAGTRDPTVTASAHAALQDLSGGRIVLGVGRGDSAARLIGAPPTRIADFERALVALRDLLSGRPTTWNGVEVDLAWARGLPAVPIHVAAYGPRALGLAGRLGDGLFVQLADPDIAAWLVAQAREAAAAAGRDPEALEVTICTAAYVDDDVAAAREQVRWFPALVGNHVVDLLRRQDRSALPPALVDYVERREFYDYREHARVGAAHADYVDDDTCDRFCVVGPLEAHAAKLQRLADLGVTQVNLYLLTSSPQRTIELYARELIPRFAGVVA
jgi:probable F420-dependent oxidoreductase